jgi:hypothetical protein
MSTESNTYTVEKSDTVWVIDTVRTHIDPEVGFVGTVRRWVFVQTAKGAKFGDVGDVKLISDRGEVIDCWALHDSDDSHTGQVARFYVDELIADQVARTHE